MRTFIAIEVPDEAKEAARQYQEAWRDLWPEKGVSWTRPEGFHLTLRFLGEIQESQAREIGERLQSLATAAPIPMAFPGPIGFPNLRRPHVLALEIDAPPDLQRLADDLDRALKGLRLDPRDKPLRPHLTLGRVRAKDAPVPQPPPFKGPVAWTATRVALVQSFMGPGGSRYEDLAAVDLAGEAR